MSLEVGQPFPDFSLPNEKGETIDKDGLKGRSTVIYFYPKDDTSGCTLEAKEFAELVVKYPQVRILGCSPDSPKSHQKFIEKYGLNFSLIADESHSLAEACGVWVEKSMYGNVYMGVERTTFLLDPNGFVLEIWKKVKPEGHASIVMQACDRA